MAVRNFLRCLCCGGFVHRRVEGDVILGAQEEAIFVVFACAKGSAPDPFDGAGKERADAKQFVRKTPEQFRKNMLHYTPQPQQPAAPQSRLAHPKHPHRFGSQPRRAKMARKFR